MNISNWPDMVRMTLPDWIFGQRLPVSVSYYTTQAGIVYAISDQALPDKCVVWQISYLWGRVAGSLISISIKLGDHLPGAAAEYEAMQEVMEGIGHQGVGFKQTYFDYTTAQVKWDMKKLIYPQGNRLVMRVNFVATAVGLAKVVMIVSSLPTEIPEWYRSGQLPSR